MEKWSNDGGPFGTVPGRVLTPAVPGLYT